MTCDAGLEQLIAEHKVWADAHRREWLIENPHPVGAWDGNNWHGLIGNNIRRWLGDVRPLADAWWRKRGYILKWTDCGAIPERAGHELFRKETQ